MSALSPVARMARPSRVLRNSPSSTATAAAARAATIRRDCPCKAVPSSRARILVNTVAVLFIFSTDEPPITAMLTEYSAVLTMMPESRLLTPIFVCSSAVQKPDSTPAAIAAGSAR